MMTPSTMATLLALGGVDLAGLLGVFLQPPCAKWIVASIDDATGDARA
jgi:hypothetical protein